MTITILIEEIIPTWENNLYEDDYYKITIDERVFTTDDHEEIIPIITENTKHLI